MSTSVSKVKDKVLWNMEMYLAFLSDRYDLSMTRRIEKRVNRNLLSPVAMPINQRVYMQVIWSSYPYFMMKVSWWCHTLIFILVTRGWGGDPVLLAVDWLLRAAWMGMNYNIKHETQCIAFSPMVRMSRWIWICSHGSRPRPLLGDSPGWSHTLCSRRCTPRRCHRQTAREGKQGEQVRCSLQQE